MQKELNYIILLPTSENKNQGGDETKPYRLVKNKKEYNFFKNNLWIQRENIYATLREAISKLSFLELEKVFDLKKDNLKQAIQNNEDILNQPTIPAISRFNGTMFKYINYQNLDENIQKKFNQSVIFIDSLFGLLKPLDLIPNYKLKISSKFLNIDTKKFWKEHINKILQQISKDKIIIDILPQSHREILDLNNNNNLNYKYIQINFMERKNNKIINSGHNSKQLKAELIKFILEKNSLKINDLENFSHSLGFIFNKKLSNNNTICFLKE